MMIFPKTEQKKEEIREKSKLAEVKSAVSTHTRRLNDLKAKEKEAIRTSRIRLEKETNFLEEQRKVLANEVQILELRRQQALEPIEKELNEVKKLHLELDDKTSALQDEKTGLKELEERLEARGEAVEHRFMELEREMVKASEFISQAKKEKLELERLEAEVKAQQTSLQAGKERFFKQQKAIWDENAIKEALLKAEAQRIEDLKLSYQKEANKAASEREKLAKAIEIVKAKGLWQTVQEMTTEK